jgi:hypothetical protein
VIHPVEVTTKYVATVAELPEAWAFVMERLESVGPDPEVSIRPIRILSVVEVMDDPEATAQRMFEVVVSGMVPETP